jgi:NAD(P)-dependent dehydrogenase (short-subunit alcohol dehydrogenase family)
MQSTTLTPVSLSAQCLKGKVILITGASKGIGRAIALKAAEYGATVILVSKTVKKLEAVYDEIVSLGYVEPAIHPLNLANMSPDDAATLAQSIEKMFGRCDAIIHNAGISGPITPLEHLAPHKWQEVIQLNLNVPYLITHALLPLLKQSDSASILFTSADESKQAKAYWSAYCASKFGILGLAKSLHEELENNTAIRVNCINPGKVRTALRLNAYPGLDPESFALPETLSKYYVYLLSNEANSLRGREIKLPPES